ncbi:hypothetical protein BJP40_25965 [Streptomyces sp. CC53]|uniref:hypothetical protein n=1 Tax=Streptomyces sp. CC53 TaxID=1906740 RepID=UPI0008DC9176|nr:hypothetical protein [Streptomyces sp. CC53]OII63154.1 hypothetical protein BJP40_25965 [Streptomyces sp. CC53]
MTLRIGITGRASLLLTTMLTASTLTACTPLDLARYCEGTASRVRETAALDILDSRPAGASVAQGFEEVDAGCWADSGDIVVYADRWYAFPGTRSEVTAHYRSAALRDGWGPASEAPSTDLCFVKGTMSLWIVFATAERLAEDGLGHRPDLTTGAGYSIGVDSYEHSGGATGC